MMIAAPAFAAAVLLPQNGDGFAISGAGTSWYDNDVATAGTGYLAVWKAYGGGIKGQLLDSTGGKTGPGFTISLTGDNPTVASGGGRSLVVYTSGQDVLGRFVGTDGSPGTVFVIDSGSSTAYYPDVIYNGEKFLVVWGQYLPNGGNSQVWGRFVDSSGPTGQQFLIGNPARNNWHPIAAYGDGMFFVAWTSETAINSANRDIYGARVDAQGTVLDAPDIPVCTKTGSQDLGAWMHGGITYDGTNYVVLWRDYAGTPIRISAARISPAGILLDGPADTGGKFIGSAGSSSPTGTQIVYDGTALIAVWDGGKGMRLDPALNPVDAAPFTYTTGPAQNPALVNGGGRFLVIWDNAVQVTGGGDTLMGQVLAYGEEPGTANRPPVLAPIGPKEVYEIDQAGQPLSFTVSATDPDGDALAFTTGTLPAGAYFDPVNRQFLWPPQLDQAGTYTVTFTVSDGALSDSETVTITVLNLNHIPMLYVPPSQAVDEGKPLTFQVWGEDPDPGDVLTYMTESLPAGAAFDPATRTFSWTPGFDQAGGYSVEFRVMDSEGMMMAAVVGITVNNVNHPPVLNAIGTKTADEGRQLQFTVSGSDPDGTPVTYSAANLPAGAQFSGSTFTWTPAYDQAGSCTVTFTVSDGTLSDSETVTITVNNVNSPPVLDPIGPKQVYEVDQNSGQPLFFTVSAFDPEGDALAFTTGTLPRGAFFNPSNREFTWFPALDQAGTYTVTFTVSDGEFSDSEAVTITVLNLNHIPLLYVPPAQAVDEGKPLTFQVRGEDPDPGDVLTYMTESLPGGAAFDPATRTFSWTPGFDQAGGYSVEFRVMDSEGMMMAAVVGITVNDVILNRPPVIAPVGPKSADEGQVLSFTLSATDPDGNALTYSAANLPAGAAFDAGTKTFSWTPGFSQSGSYTVTFTVSDGSLSDAEAVTITVNNVNRAPVLDPVGPKSVDEGRQLQFSVSGSDPDGTPVTFSAATLPAGAAFSGSAVTWTPGFDQAGTYTVTFTVSDGTLTDTEAVTITVSNVNRPPVAEAGPALIVLVNEPAQFDGSRSSDPDGAIASYAWNFGDGTTGSGVTATHIYTAAANYTVTLTVSDNEGAAGFDMTKVWAQTPAYAIQEIIREINGMQLKKGTENSLTAKLDAAVQSLGKGNTNAAKNQLNACINEITAQDGKGLTGDQAAALTAKLQKVINYL